MLLSPHFDLQEFLVSQTAARMGRMIEPNAIQIANITRLCMDVLEPLRLFIERPVIITSGIRPSWLNDAVGGAPGSAHMGGYAADIIAPGMTPLALASHLAMLESMRAPTDYVVDQLILEFDSWVHIGIAPEGEIPRHQLLTARKINGQTIYNEGLLYPNKVMILTEPHQTDFRLRD